MRVIVNLQAAAASSTADPGTGQAPPVAIKCPKCEYVGKTRHTVLLHYGITHRIVVKYIDEALKKDPSLATVSSSSSAVQTNTTVPSSTAATASPSLLKRQQLQLERLKDKPFRSASCTFSSHVFSHCSDSYH